MTTMKTRTDIVEARMAAFRAECERRGLKLTHQRLEIYRELASTEQHPDADTVHRRVRKRIPVISKDTVYRNLKLLAEHGLISIVGLSHERLRFDANMESHHHFVCVRCGRIQDFCSPNLADIKMPQEAKIYGNPVSLHLEVKGVCVSCQSPGKGPPLATAKKQSKV